MTEDRLSGIEEKLDALVTGQAELRVGLVGVQTRLDGVETRLDGVETRLGGVETRLDKVEVGQEDMRDQIKQIAEGHGATQAALERGFETLRVHIDRRIDSLEQVVRRHSAILEAHNLTLPEGAG